MILARLKILNYKQYAGEHDIRIPAQATIGVIGTNGVGKTTLFEAIEWCLYNPTTIENRNIRPRGLGGTTRVAVTLETPDGSRRFVVERELGRTTTKASIAEVDEHGEEQILVQGSRPVTDYVTRTLIGLPHAAFVATFFTRQKELHFFGDLKETSRRREVGRLLGLETIRIAQQAIAEDRRQAQAAADSLQRQYADQSAGRDFTREAAERDREVVERQGEVRAATARAAILTATLGELTTSLAALEALRDQDAALGPRISQGAAQLDAMRDRQAHVASEIERLTARAAQRTHLEPIAARLDERQAALAELDLQRSQHSRRREIELRIREQERGRRELLDTVHSTVEGVTLVVPVDAWGWRNGQDDRAPAAIGDLLGALDRLDVAGAESREAALARCRDADAQLTQWRSRLERFHAERHKLEQRRQELLADGDPTAESAALEGERDALHERIATLTAERATREGEGDQARQLLRNLEASHFGDLCPTCARPFAPGDEEVVIASLRDRVRKLSAELAGLTRSMADLRARSEEIARKRAALAERSSHLLNVESRIQASEGPLNEQQGLVDTGAKALDEALQAAQLDRPPGDDALRQAALVAGQYRQMVATRTPLRSMGRRLATLAAERARADEELAPVAEATFDEAAYRDAMGAHQEAARARATIEQMDQELARRPGLEAENVSILDRIATSAADLQALERERGSLGFDPARLAEARSTLESTRNEERLAHAAVHAANSTLREAEHARASLQRERERIAQLAADADARRRDADDLDRMYREFNEFERYAADRLTPLLSDMTSELVRDITDGRYDRVEFDSNFGIEVYDGAEERFPLETFSGGERDAIALAARLALSRMIGGAGANPPGFLVLDEVFGSLDRDRRTRLLNLLGTITGSFEDFRQIFVISHVDDVRSSAVFEELWRIDEGGDGASQLRSLPAGEDIGEL